MQAGNDHRLELQALGLVHCHHLHRLAGQRVGRREQFGHPRRQCFCIQPPAGGKFIEQGKKRLHIRQRRRCLQTLRPAQHQPDRLQPTPRRLPATFGKRQPKHARHMRQPLPAVV